MRHIVGVGFLLLYLSLSYANEQIISFDTLYLPTAFNRVESVCKELWADLDMIKNNEDLHKKFIYDSSYLFDQFLLLEKRIERMVLNEEEANSYLLEDIHYLAELIETVEAKYQAVCAHLATEADELIYSINTLLEQSKEYVVTLYAGNKEVLG